MMWSCAVGDLAHYPPIQTRTLRQNCIHKLVQNRVQSEQHFRNRGFQTGKLHICSTAIHSLGYITGMRVISPEERLGRGAIEGASFAAPSCQVLRATSPGLALRGCGRAFRSSQDLFSCSWPTVVIDTFWQLGKWMVMGWKHKNLAPELVERGKKDERRLTREDLAFWFIAKQI